MQTRTRAQPLDGSDETNEAGEVRGGRQEERDEDRCVGDDDLSSRTSYRPGTRQQSAVIRSRRQVGEWRSLARTDLASRQQWFLQQNEHFCGPGSIFDEPHRTAGGRRRKLSSRSIQSCDPHTPLSARSSPSVSRLQLALTLFMTYGRQRLAALLSGQVWQLALVDNLRHPFRLREVHQIFGRALALPGCGRAGQD